MVRKGLFPLILLWLSISYGQADCPLITLPAENAIDVSTQTTISWNAVNDASGYFLMLGTTPGGQDIVDRVDVGNTTTYVPPSGLPENTEIHVELMVYFENTPVMTCPTRSFTTGDSTSAGLMCSTFISPENGDSEVPTTTELEWTPVAGATGYRLIFYHDATGRQIEDVITHAENRTGQIILPANTTFFLRIMPFNEVGNALGCAITSFTTVAECEHTINAIDDFYQCDLNGDSFEEFHIDLDVLETMLIGNQTGLTVTYHTLGGDLIDFSIGTQFSVNQTGVMARATDVSGCFKETTFNLVVLPAPNVPTLSDVFECETYVLPELAPGNEYFTGSTGLGTRLEAGESITDSQRIYIYAEVGDCSEQRSFQINIDPRFCQDDSVEIAPIVFPKFFTPNNDGVNDFWEVNPGESLSSSGVAQIFDRYGKLITQFDTSTNTGWDGTSQGKPLSASDYWFRVVLQDGREFKGHFTLKR